MVRDDPTPSLFCVLVGVGVVALVLAAGEGPDRRFHGSFPAVQAAEMSPASAVLLTRSPGGSSLDHPSPGAPHGHP